MTPGLQGEQLYHYTAEASFPIFSGATNFIFSCHKTREFFSSAWKPEYLNIFFRKQLEQNILFYFFLFQMSEYFKSH